MQSCYEVISDRNFTCSYSERLLLENTVLVQDNDKNLLREQDKIYNDDHINTGDCVIANVAMASTEYRCDKTPDSR